MNFPILSAITFLPLLGAIVVLLIPSRQERAIKWTALAFSAVTLILSTWLWINFDPKGGIQFEELYRWIPTMGIEYRMGVDGLSVPLIFLTALLTTVSIGYSFYITERPKEYFFLFLLLGTAMFGVFTSLNYFLFYIFWELSLVPMYFLIGVWGGPNRRYAAIKFFLYTLAGSVLMLLAIIAMYFEAGTFDILKVAEAQPFAGNFTLQSLVFWGLFLGFAIKVPVWPFHTWLPDAHVEAPTAGSVILAGVLLKLGTYALVRILIPTVPGAFQAYAWIVGILALGGIIYGALVAMAQWDLKKIIAYSSVNHMGYVVLGVAAAVGTYQNLMEPTLLDRTLALNGAILQMFNHGIITGALFILVGVIYERAHKRDVRLFGGLRTKMPLYAGLMIFMSMASLGLPGLAGFVSEFLVFRGSFPSMTLYTSLAVIGVVVTAAMFLWKVIQLPFLGPFDEEKWGFLTDINAREVLSLVPLMFFTVLIGVYPSFILGAFNDTVVRLLETYVLR